MVYKAKVRFLGSDEGGRYFPPMSGYKPQLKIGNEKTSCRIILENSNSTVMDFGIEHTVIIELQFEDYYQDKFFLKERIELYEGAKLVGTGEFL
jgi:translation elongation factor EF-Tu-like GTPase